MRIREAFWAVTGHFCHMAADLSEGFYSDAKVQELEMPLPLSLLQMTLVIALGGPSLPENTQLQSDKRGAGAV